MDAPFALPVRGEHAAEGFVHKALPIYVDVDAVVQAPQEVCTPVYQVQRRLFTESDAKRIAAVLMGSQSSEQLVPSVRNEPQLELTDETQRYLIGGGMSGVRRAVDRCTAKGILLVSSAIIPGSI